MTKTKPKLHGTLRFILAILVALSHLGLTFYGFNFGVSAVVVFYLLAGMVSFKLISKHYAAQAKLYYIDRVIRIFPLYFLVLLFAYIVYFLGGSSYFISAKPDLISHLSNITIIPLSYYIYSGIDSFTLLPPVWSLGVELQFYLLAPFILLHQKRITIFLYLSLSIYILAAVGILNTDHYGYRLIAGVLFIFLLGAKLEKEKKIDFHLIVIYLLLLVTAIYIFLIDYKAPYNYETIIALLISIPLLKNTKHQTPKPQAPTPKIDKYLGRLSYAIFLSHFPVLWAVELYGYSNKDFLFIIFVTILLSMVFIYIEKLIIKYIISYKYITQRKN